MSRRLPACQGGRLATAGPGSQDSRWPQRRASMSRAVSRARGRYLPRSTRTAVHARSSSLTSAKQEIRINLRDPGWSRALLYAAHYNLGAVSYLYVALGALVGAPLRFLVGNHVQPLIGGQFPWGTLVVNVTGCFLIGVVAALADRHDWSSGEVRLLLVTGILGSYTTFSSFSFETYYLARSDEALQAGVYVVGSVAVGLAATWVGAQVGRLGW